MHFLLAAAGALSMDPDTATAFNGTTSKISCDAPTLAFSERAPFSIEAWAKPAAGGESYQHILNRENPDSAGLNRQGYAIYLRPSVGVYFERFLNGDNLQAG